MVDRLRDLHGFTVKNLAKWAVSFFITTFIGSKIIGVILGG